MYGYALSSFSIVFVFRTVLFDKVALQHERLQFGIRHNILKAGDMRDHPLNLRPFVAARLEILADTVFSAKSPFLRR